MTKKLILLLTKLTAVIPVTEDYGGPRHHSLSSHH